MATVDICTQARWGFITQILLKIVLHVQDKAYIKEIYELKKNMTRLSEQQVSVLKDYKDSCNGHLF